MASVAMSSLLQTVIQLLKRNPLGISDEADKLFKSLTESVKYLTNFIVDNSNRGQDTEKIKELECRIGDAANQAKYMIELKIYEINHVENCSRFESASQAFCQTLLPIVVKFDALQRDVSGSSLDTNEIHGYGDPTNETAQGSCVVTNELYEDLQMGDFFLGQSSRHAANLNLKNLAVGLEDDLVKIMGRVKGPPSSREIFSILRMGGIGKTTLAKIAYDHPEIRRHFDVHVWVIASQEYRIRDLLLGILSCISQLTNKIENAAPKNEMKKETNNQLMDMIYKRLKYRRYLVVMDDIWSNDVWDLMTRSFPDDNNGSQIILTSRLNVVAMHADPDRLPHEMNLLSSDNSWKLLHEKIFGAKHVFPAELEDIGKKIAGKCQGLPLALLVVAGHLSKIGRSRQSWEDVAKSMSKVVASEPGKCLGVLVLSYSYLPNHLRPCFLSMGAFPEDFEVKTQRLIQLWVIDGFLRKERVKSLEEVGRECLEDLVGRNLIMARRRRYNGEFKSCGLHDLVRDLILREAEKEKFLLVKRIHEVSNPSESKPRFHRYSFHSGIPHGDCWNSSPSLARMLYYFNGRRFASAPSKLVPLLTHFKLLRVLAILQVTFQHFPLEITKLVHLRYLEFNCHDDLHWSVFVLYKLQTLVFGHDYSVLPAGIWEMKDLKHLHIRSISSLCIPSSMVESGFKLQTLEGLSAPLFSCCTKELSSSIPNLKRLKIHGASGECNRKIISQSLNNPSGLHKLEILKFICATRVFPLPVPSKYVLAISLKRLTLRRTYLPWEDMSNIVMLPNLEVLKIKDRGFYGEVRRLNDDEIFNQLKFLLIDWTNLVHWEASSINFPNLQHLVMKGAYTWRKSLQTLRKFIRWSQ